MVFIPGQHLHTTFAECTGKYVGIVHTIVAYAGFLGALFVGLALHYEKVTRVSRCVVQMAHVIRL